MAPGGARPREVTQADGARSGHIEKLPSGSARVKVYGGRDTLTGRSLYLTETVPAGPDVDVRAEEARAALAASVARGEHPRTDATVDELMDRHLAEAKLSRKTRSTLLGYHRKHIAPLLGRFKINGVLDPEVLDTFYAELARCRDHCTGRSTVKHWTDRPHTCSERCTRHVCRPLSDWTIRKIRGRPPGAGAAPRSGGPGAGAAGS